MSRKLANALRAVIAMQKGGGGASLQDIELPEVDAAGVDAQASDLDVSDEDLEFVKEHGRRIGFLENLDSKELDKSIRAKQEKQARDAAEARKAAAEAGEGGEGEEGGSEDDEDEDEEGARKASRHRAAGSDEEEEAYEQAPRRHKVDPKDRAAAAGGLPIKTITGEVVFTKEGEGRRGGRRGKGEADEAMQEALAAVAAIQVEGVTITDDMETALAENKRKAAEEAEARAKEEKRRAAAAAKKAEEAALPPALRGLNLSGLDAAERRTKLQEVMATAAQKLLASPEAGMGELRTLQALVTDGDSMVSRLAMLSLLAVFKDILPGYRIRPPTEKELEVKVSKEVAKLRDHEQALLKAYQTYLRSLLDAANCVRAGTGTLSHSRVAVRCLSGLLAAHPHFNYTSDILQAVVPRMAAHDPETRSMACEAVRALLAAGAEGGDDGGAGKAGLEAVQLVADLVRKRKCVAPPELVRALTVLRFREVKRKAPEEEEEGRKRKGKKAEKRDVKRRRKEDEVARAFKESQAGPDREELARQQSAMLEALFEVYFRVLKHACAVGLGRGQAGSADLSGAGEGPAGGSGSGGSSRAGAGAGPGAGAGAGAAGPPGGDAVASCSLGLAWSRTRLLKKCPLLHAVLDGLARYTHLISVDYMADLMACFMDLLSGPGLPLNERLRLLATIAALLKGQGEALNVDRRELYVQLYDILLQVPLHSLLSNDPAPIQPNGAAANDQPPTAADDEDDEADDAADFAAAAACQAADADSASAPPPPGQDSSATPSAAACLAGVLEALLVDPRQPDMQRAAAFTKRMASAALHAGPGEAMALWAAVGRMLRRYPRLANMLEYEGEAPTVGGRTYDPWSTDPSEAGALSTTLWEICHASGAQPHVHPHLAAAAASLLALRPGAAASGGGGSTAGGAIALSGPLGTPATITELAEAYDTSRGLIRPPPHKPRRSGGGGGGGGKKRNRRGGGGAAELSEEFLEEVARQGLEYTAAGGSWVGLGVDSDDDAPGFTAADVADLDLDLAASGSSDADARRQRALSNGAATSGAGANEAGAEAEAVVGSSLRRMFLEARRFSDNRVLRREKAAAVERLKRFHIHLQQRQAGLGGLGAGVPSAAAGAAQGQAQGQGRVGKARR
ncbi:hypothetical protein HYH03_015482 [Edaphochlamys debaryana]|uniref:Uncharacterized protein n=1 Tax=Edaphochlamys debaryana TaxID=47281 RepID=A0A835XN08_9CHLO|nr:hypothetical protein HYH03_015482 [Edaphochlamys debaryana]|eukprot:KAG2485768.1 hypothetical protein HYH03_015482 [Edaphochlamys debaryana]